MVEELGCSRNLKTGAKDGVKGGGLIVGLLVLLDLFLYNSLSHLSC